jgi:hypothetical protein
MRPISRQVHKLPLYQRWVVFRCGHWGLALGESWPPGEGVMFEVAIVISWTVHDLDFVRVTNSADPS